MIMDTLDNFMRGCCNSNSTVTSHVPLPVGDGQQLTNMKKKTDNIPNKGRRDSSREANLHFKTARG
jgi:hypothetical protein